ncbi:rhodanese-like domain-containing protein [Allomuricauda sp. F6463D]|uniref:rhodanese-like domain-containing protein n=1 Tax=Allomuricauda sp. F6463D TaxID=2926409 RepID=UPI001FF2FEE3|nr:rhodanese-like domain-containing protein [Muricauda sp. F6463D]MCK0160989.1 rhodanese-like domain-containing protein [Muricauda sp. F6463D]
MRHIIKFVLFLVFAGTLSCHSQKDKVITRIDKAEMNSNVIGKAVQLIDVRTPGEYNAGHIDDAINFDISKYQNFIEQINTLDKEDPVYLYCAVGARSIHAAKILKSKGFTKIYDYSGGYDDWIRD